MSDIAAILKNIPTDDLISELRRRPGIVPSIWSTEDVSSLIQDEAACGQMTEKQSEALAICFLQASARSLESMLAEKGNDFLADRWEIEKEKLISEIETASLS